MGRRPGERMLGLGTQANSDLGKEKGWEAGRRVCGRLERSRGVAGTEAGGTGQHWSDQGPVRLEVCQASIKQGWGRSDFLKGAPPPHGSTRLLLRH